MNTDFRVILSLFIYYLNVIAIFRPAEVHHLRRGTCQTSSKDSAHHYVILTAGRAKVNIAPSFALSQDSAVAKVAATHIVVPLADLADVNRCGV